MNNGQQWIVDIKVRGWAHALTLMIDAIEPLGVLGAQMLYVTQPAMSVFGLGETVRGLAAALETPEGIAALRAALGDTPDDPPSE